MGTEATISASIDHGAGAGYLRFTTEAVAATEEFDDTTLVDLDKFGMVVGIEILDLEADVPLMELITRYHIGSEAAALLCAVNDHYQAKASPAPVAAAAVPLVRYGAAALRAGSSVVTSRRGHRSARG